MWFSLLTLEFAPPIWDDDEGNSLQYLKTHKYYLSVKFKTKVIINFIVSFYKQNVNLVGKPRTYLPYYFYNNL